MKRWLTTVGVVLGVMLIAGIAVASIPGPDGVIHGCYKTSDGKLRVIDSSASCASGETALAWNQTGPQGATGATGPQGTPGEQRYYDVSLSFTLPAGAGSGGGGARECDTGDVAVGDGYNLAGSFDGNAGVVVDNFGVGTAIAGNPNQLSFHFTNTADAGAVPITVSVTCADLSPFRS